MLTEKDYCDYETCVALKELGYDGYCAAYYHLFDDDEDARNSFEYAYGFDFQNSNNIYRVGAPLLYQAQKWLREEKDIHIEIDRIGYPTGYGWQVSIIEMEYNLCKSVINNNKSYEEALSEGIKEALNILKKNETL